MLKQQHCTLTNVKKVKSQSTTPLRFSPKSVSFELLLALRCFVNTGPGLVTTGERPVLWAGVDMARDCWHGMWRKLGGSLWTEDVEVRIIFNRDLYLTLSM